MRQQHLPEERGTEGVNDESMSMGVSTDVSTDVRCKNPNDIVAFQSEHNVKPTKNVKQVEKNEAKKKKKQTKIEIAARGSLNIMEMFGKVREKNAREPIENGPGYECMSDANHMDMIANGVPWSQDYSRSISRGVCTENIRG